MISPWNFPLQLSHRSAAPAIALGNTVVLKPAENTPITGGLLLARIYEEVGLPPGVLNVVIGKGGEIGDALATHETSRMISFTGSTEIGPIIDDDQRDGIRDLVGRSVEQGARLLLSGDPYGPAGRVLPPHLLLATNDLPCASEEVFGPVATVIRAKDEEDALRIANDTEYGLSSSVYTRDAERGVRFAHRLHAGMTHVNDSSLNDEANTAFGGEDHSGIGRFGGEWAIEESTADHWISVQHTRRRLPFGLG